MSLIPLILLAASQFALPDSRLTPGATLPGVTAADVCTPGWARRHRHVTREEKREVYRLYHQAYGTAGEIDHLISLELGGSNDIKNLWPQPAPDYRVKDELENRLHEAVCGGSMTLQSAQQCIAKDWVQCQQKVPQD